MDESATRTAEELDSHWSTRQKALLAGSLLAVAVAGTFVFREWGEYRDDQAVETAQSSAVQAAEDVAVKLATIRPDSAREDIEALAEQGTPEFAKQVRANIDDQVDLITDNKVASKGEVEAAGLVDLDGDRATVAIAMTSQVTNGASKGKDEDRSYRMTVSLERAGDRWLASEVVFVQ